MEPSVAGSEFGYPPLPFFSQSIQNKGVSGWRLLVWPLESITYNLLSLQSPDFK